jgi:hypothetical protein
MTDATSAIMRRWMVQRSDDPGRAAPRVAARAADTRSSSQPSAAIPTDTTNAIGNSRRIGAAGTAVDTTAVIRLIGFQQFITQNPR